MKKLRLTVIVLAFCTLPYLAIASDPPDPGSSPQAGGDPPLGGGAPIGNGLFILLGLSAVYSAYKTKKNLKSDIERDESTIRHNLSG